MVGRSLPDSLSGFIDQRRTPDSEWSAQVVNRTDPEPIQTMAEGLYDGLDIETSETELDGLADDLFLVLRDGRVVASSPLGILKDTLLMVNVDRYRTGTQLVGEIDVPDVILELSDTVFSLEGFPESNTEKLVLTLIARYIEQRALGLQTGTLRSSFQRLSRLDDERGTREFYEQLGRTEGVETHVYGVPDWEPPAELGLNCHEVVDDEIRESWVVVYRTGAPQDAAMVAVETGRNTWDGYWTFDPDEVRAVDRYITETF
jgi:DICT domain-containing protein